MADAIGMQFEVHIFGEESGDLFAGKFRAREKLSWSNRLEIDRIRRELLGPSGAEAGVEVQGRATILAELAVRVTESPEWFKTARNGLDLIDDNLVMEIYSKTQDIQQKWQAAQKEKAEAAKKALLATQDKK